MLQASYESLYHNYLASNKVTGEAGAGAVAGAGAGADKTAEVMAAILQVETGRRQTCVIM